MYLKKEKEFQYHPGIEKIIEDVIGGGTIARAEMVGAAFGGIQLDELPPLVVVGIDAATGVYHVVKTAAVQAIAAADAVVYRVKKNHLFIVGSIVTKGGALATAANTITAIDKTNVAYDAITLDVTIGAAAVGDVLVLAKAAAVAGAAEFKYAPLYLTMNKVDLAVANQSSGLLVRGTVNSAVLPFPLDAALKALLKDIRFA